MQNLNQVTLDEQYEFYEKQGFSKKEIIKQISKDRGVNKNEIYLKQYNSQNGLPIFCTFQLIQEPTNEVNKKTEPNIYENNFKALNDKIDGLYSLISTIQVEPKSEQVSDQVSDQVSEKTDQVKKGGKNAK